MMLTLKLMVLITAKTYGIKNEPVFEQSLAKPINFYQPNNTQTNDRVI
jgi:hypothetical protein